MSHNYNTRSKPLEENQVQKASMADSDGESVQLTEMENPSEAQGAVGGTADTVTPRSQPLNDKKQIMEFGKEMGLAGKELVDFVMSEINAERQLQLESERGEREFQLRQLEIQSRSNGNTNNNAHVSQIKEPGFVPKLPYMTDTDCPASFLRQYELYARDLELSPEQKASRLIYFLKGKARTIATRLSDEELKDYEIIKAAILEGFQLNAEQYRIKFRSSKKESDESYKEYVIRLERYLTKWVELEKSDKDVKDITDLMLREQVTKQLSPELAVFVKDRKPKNAREVGQLAMDYELNRNHSSGGGNKSNREHGSNNKAPNKGKGSSGHYERVGGSEEKKRENKSSTVSENL